MMNIAIAAWHLKDFNVGLGRYCRGLIEAIGRVDTENRYEILMPVGTYRFPDRPNFRYRPVRVPLFKRRVWEQVAPLLSGPYDLLHFPYDSCVAMKRGKFVVTIHDVKPLLFGELASRRNVKGLLERWLVGEKWAKIDHVLTDSDCSRKDILDRLNLPQDRVTVVYPGVELEHFRPASSEDKVEVEAEVKENEKIRPSALTLTCRVARPYVLCVAGGDPTKNVETLMQSFARLPRSVRESHDLVLTGDFRRREDPRQLVAHADIEKQTIFTGVVNDERLVELYQQATLFVFPSRYEGFGLPVLEAMACGCPVICSNASSLPEVAGDAAILVDPMDVEGFTHEMDRVLTSSDLRRNLRGRGLAQAARFSWDRTARETIAVYKKVLCAK